MRTWLAIALVLTALVAAIEAKCGEQRVESRAAQCLKNKGNISCQQTDSFSESECICEGDSSDVCRQLRIRSTMCGCQIGEKFHPFPQYACDEASGCNCTNANIIIAACRN
ncbi:PREDICTED: uncharacterized protein LOC106807995 [Priapulus caudatus]|uniref:Uncharacterized protein LOC106807995 n=1 Tax=Priapulus caudatus TaxID=37621 RepID=A0ABM1E1E9_PRICU|nr:PREDICTED: uncharacterized protein LOC106807995 [Priapulus caudatus]